MVNRNFRRFLALTLPHRWKMAGGAGLIVLSTLLTLPSPWIFKLLIDQALPCRDLRLFAALLAAFAALFLLRGWVTLARNRLLQFTAMRIVCDLRIRMFAHLQTLSLRYFDSNQTGKVVSRITQDTNEVYQLTNGFLIGLLADTVTVIGVLGLLYWANWRLALGVSTVLPFFALSYRRNRQHMRRESRIHRDHWDRVVGFLHEKLGAARVIKSFTREDAESDVFREYNWADYGNFSTIVLRNTRISVLADMLSSLGALIVLGYGGWMVIHGTIQVGTLVAFYGYIAFIFPPIVRFVDLATVFQRANTALENIWTLLDTEPEVTDRPKAIELPTLRGRVEFQHVAFDYHQEPPGNGRPRTLVDVNFVAEPGQMVAIVGPSGSGKSTLVNLVARFYDVAAGRVLIDGTDVRAAAIASLRRQIGIVLQENVLFSGSVEENIWYGRPDATREEVRAAAVTANAHDFISELPEGYATTVGERGARLSGGQRQRIAIARAILRNPRILIFDEATSALDTQAERLIQQAMERLMQGRTTFVIAHRLSTIHRADQILLMDQGRLAERGTHAELLAAGGLYARLHSLQFESIT